jgi:hypothetical protein
LIRRLKVNGWTNYFANGTGIDCNPRVLTAWCTGSEIIPMQGRILERIPKGFPAQLSFELFGDSEDMTKAQ